MKRILLAILIVVCCCDYADAFGRRRRRRSNNYTSYNYSPSSMYSSPQQAAEAKVAILAARGYGFHPGGGYGGGYREGWGMGATAEQARWSTCYGSQCNSARGAAQAWSQRAGCWFAINIW